jgi:DNA-binding winged helix-turn-helix (wHTH) protein/Tfp pilus assembly protein PilF
MPMYTNTIVGTTQTPLAYRPDFTLADATVRPSLRTLEGPNASVPLEPKVMQILLAFADAAGAVVTREDLLRECWQGRIVGEDAVNRTIVALRKSVRRSGASFAIETIPKIGYRLALGETMPGESAARAGTGTTRRSAVATLVGGLAVAGGMVVWRQRGTGSGAAVKDLRAKGRRALHDGFPDSGRVAARHLEAAVAEAPRDAEAWGLLAFAYRDIAEGAPPERVSGAVQASERAARRALELDARQGDALAALATLKPFFGDFAAGEDRLMTALALAPDTFLAMNILIPLLQGVGRVELSARWNERAGRIDPHLPVPQYRRALKLWAVGHLSAADQAMDRTMQLWPRIPPYGTRA